jgi:predicted enzyme related to lactoylglutathione lyase
MTDGDLLGRLVWYELMTTDPRAAEGFYTQVVGWSTQADVTLSVPYTTWMKGDTPVGGLMLLPEEAKAAGAPPGWLMYVGTPDVAATLERARELGARVEVEPRDAAGAGRFALFSDPQGAVVALLEPSDPDLHRESPPEALDISWRELATSDPRAAVAFYTSLFRWERLNASDMGPGGVYQEFGRGGTPLGGIYTKPTHVTAPPRWLLYARVKDIRAAAARVRSLGGRVVNGPMEIAGGDLVCEVADPQGAAFALHQPKG